MYRGLLPLKGLVIVPFFLTSCSYLSQSIIFSVIQSSIFVIVSYAIGRKDYIKLTPFFFLIHFDCLFSIPMLLTLLSLDMSQKLKKYLSIYCAIFIIISLFNFNYKMLFIYFWAIPQTLLVSFMVYVMLMHVRSIYLLVRCFIFIVLITRLFMSIIPSNKMHIAFKGDNNSVVITENSLKNSSKNSDFLIVDGFNKELCQKENNIFSIFLPEFNSNIEGEIISSDDMKGIFYLYGEHDNYNDFIYNMSRFKNDKIQQAMPWSYNRPFFYRDLLIASYQDPFYCSNIGTTIQRFPQLIPYAWRYNRAGIPILLIAKESFKTKDVFYIGDSDPLVRFLAPYNRNFLNAFYGDKNYIDMLRIAIFASLLFFTNYNILCITSCILFGMYFTPLQNNLNKFDMAVSFVDSDILSPHTENDVSSLIKNVSNAGYSVTLGECGESKINIFVIKNNANLDMRLSKKSIIFLLEGASVYIDKEKYESGNTPLGTTMYEDIYIPDARLINNNAPIIFGEGYIVIGTNSPQRFKSYGEFF